MKDLSRVSVRNLVEIEIDMYSYLQNTGTAHFKSLKLRLQNRNEKTVHSSNKLRLNYSFQTGHELRNSESVSEMSVVLAGIACGYSAPITTDNE